MDGMTPLEIDAPLPNDLDAAHRLIRELLATLREQTHLNANLQHQLEQLLRRLYGRKSEKLDPNQLLLFAQEILEAAAAEPIPPPAPEPSGPKPPTKGHGRKPLPTHLPRKPIIHDVPPEQPDRGPLARSLETGGLGRPSWPKRIELGQALEGLFRSGETRGATASVRQGLLAREGQPIRAALYARVSTHDQRALGLPLEAMRAYLKSLGILYDLPMSRGVAPATALRGEVATEATPYRSYFTRKWGTRMRRAPDPSPPAALFSPRRGTDPTGEPDVYAPANARFLHRATMAFVVLGLLLRVFRYLMDFPLWCDESRLAANLIDLGYGDLGRPLRYAQTCPVGFLAVELTSIRLLGFSTWSLRLAAFASSLASVVLFRHVAGRVLSGSPLLLAVAMFSVSWWPIEFAAEVKPYASDLVAALVLLALSLEWLRRPERTAWLWGLAAAALLAVPLSFPSVFVVGGVCASLAPAVWRARRTGAWIAFLVLAIVPAATFAALLPLYKLDPQVHSYFHRNWTGAFPPTDGLVRLLSWIVSTHTGPLFAYPVGYRWGGSTLTTLCFLAGVRALWVGGKRTLLALGLAPLALNFLAAMLHRYPYGFQVRTMQYFVPAVCLFAGLGLATLIPLLGTRRTQRRLLNATLLAYLTVAAAFTLFALVHPYKLRRDQQAREFASWFWENRDDDAELVCARTDLGVVTGPAHWNGHWTDYYLVYQQIYSQRRRRNRPLDAALISESHPLKCVFFNEFPETSPIFQSWRNEMNRSYVEHGARVYTVRGRDPGAPDFVNTYVVYEFTPKPGAGDKRREEAGGNGRPSLLKRQRVKQPPS